MLLEFTCKNFRSFRDEISLSMFPVNAYNELLDNLAPVKPAGSSSKGVLTAAVIYGANASGKTNLLRAMDFARAAVCEGLGLFIGGDGIRQAFVGMENEESHFAFSIFVDGVRYRYEFSISPEGVTSEVLKAQPKAERLVFERFLSSDGYVIKQGSMYSGIETKLKGFDHNGLVLGLLSKFGIKDCVTVYHWFQDGLRIANYEHGVRGDKLIEKLRNLGEDGFSKALNAVRSADLGITGAQLSEQDFSAEELEKQKVIADRVKSIFEELTGRDVGELSPSGKKISFQFQHQIGGEQIGFGLSDESLGTITMLNLAADILDAFSEGKTLVVDEIERSLHPVLLRQLISLFFDRELNSNNAQLIFTSHDLTLMESKLLRRDQFWFVEKNHDSGASELYPLSDYSPRKDEKVKNRYLYGAYGALPYIEGVL